MMSCAKLQPTLKALLARCLFAIHGIVTIWRVTEVYSEMIYYLLAVPVCLLLLEMVVTLQCTENGEWKWFCPSVLMYITSVVPGLWLLQFDLYETRIAYRDSMGWEDCSSEIAYNASGLSANVAGFQISIPVHLADDVWAVTLEQILLALLIVGRWLLPKGSLTRDQLSQLLFVYIGMGADILEFFGESVGVGAVICSLPLLTLTMLIWSWSLCQFTLVRTSVSAAAAAGVSPAPSSKRRRKSAVSGAMGGCCGSEIWSLCVSVVMQDGPFLAVRLYLILAHGASSQLLLFFTVKNVMVVALQLYRMAILRCPGLCSRQGGDRDRGDDSDSGHPEDASEASRQRHDIEGQHGEKTAGEYNQGYRAGDHDGVHGEAEEAAETANYKVNQRPSLIGTNM